MNKITTVLLGLLLSLSTVAQDNQKGIQLKLFSGFDQYSVDGSVNAINRRQKQGSFNLLSSVSIAFVRSKHFYEFEVDKFKIKSNKTETIQTSSGLTTNGSKIKTSEFRIRMSYNYLKDLSNKTKGAIGLGLTPYWLSEKTIPLVLSSFDRRYSNYGASLDLIPRIQHYFSDKVFIEVHGVLTIARANWREQEIKNPALPRDQQLQTESTLDYFSGDYQISFGIGVTL